MVDQKHKPKWQVSEKQRSNARAVCREMTETERIICCNLRLRGVSRRTQAPAGPDVVAPGFHAAKLIARVDGGQHFEPKTIVRNARRDRYLAAQGCGVGLNRLDVMKNKAGVLEEIAVAFGGALTPCLTLRRSRRRGLGHAGREDVP